MAGCQNQSIKENFTEEELLCFYPGLFINFKIVFGTIS